jgi:hypothetical protein
MENSTWKLDEKANLELGHSLLKLDGIGKWADSKAAEWSHFLQKFLYLHNLNPLNLRNYT